MTVNALKIWTWALTLLLLCEPGFGQPVTLRVATFNVEDIRTADLLTPDHPRLKKLASVIQHLRPNIILLNEIAYDAAGGPDVPAGSKPGSNAQRFAEKYLAVRQSEDVEPMEFAAFMGATNTGMPSGLDLDKNGKVVTTYPPPGKSPAHGVAPEPSTEATQYARDCWGFGTFPGQYGMALLVDTRLTIQVDQVRTFRLLPWDYMPAAAFPTGDDGKDWYSPELKKKVRFSSKSHWDVPVKLPGGNVLHLLCSHPTPPVFDGPEKRNAKRNHDEIRFWSDYIDGEGYIVDDANKGGGLEEGATFVILGDLNADPKKGDSYKSPIASYLFANRRVNSLVTPKADVDVAGLDATDTASFKLRVDYVLPSKDIAILDAGVWRRATGPFPSDHFPVWMEIRVGSAAASPKPPPQPEAPPSAQEPHR